MQGHCSEKNDPFNDSIKNTMTSKFCEIFKLKVLRSHTNRHQVSTWGEKRYRQGSTVICSLFSRVKPDQ